MKTCINRLLQSLNKMATIFGLSTVLVIAGCGDDDSGGNKDNAVIDTETQSDTRSFAETTDATRALSEATPPVEPEVIEDTTVPVIPPIDYSSFKLSEHAPPINAEFSNFKTYTLSVKNPFTELEGRQKVYLKVMDDRGNNYYLDEMLGQTFNIQLDLEVGVRTLYIQIFSNNVETIVGVMSV